MNCILCNKPLINSNGMIHHHYNDHRFWSDGINFAFTSTELFEKIYYKNESDKIWINYIFVDILSNKIKILICNNDNKGKLIRIISIEEPIFYWKNLKELSAYIKKRLVFE